MAPDVLGIILAGLGGLVWGLAYFAGLWWTVRRMAGAASPLTLALASFVVRAGLLLAGLALLAGGDVFRLLAALAGFVLARQILLARRAGSLRRAPGPDGGLRQ